MIVLIPARSGSKRIPGKNLRLVGSEPLIGRAVRIALEAGHNPIISTDSPEIAAAARLAGAGTIERPKHLATDQATVDEVAADFGHGQPFLLLQPTVICEPHHLNLLVDAAVPTVLGVPNRHLVWNRGEAPTRVNRQLSQTHREIGVRFYPAGQYGPPQALVPVDEDILDVDEPQDLWAAQPARNIVFRVRANQRIGSGHIRRCLEIARELPQHNIGFILVDSDLWALDLVPPEWTGRLLHPDLIVNDTLDTRRGEVSRWGVPWISLEDLGDDSPDVRINALYGTGDYSGGKWADIRPEFRLVPPWKPGGNLLVSFGGTDPQRLTEQVAGELADLGPRVIPPPGRQVDADTPGLVGTTIAEEMAYASLVLTSGGRTIHEALFCGRPVLAVCQNARETMHTHLEVGQGVLSCGMVGLGGVERMVAAARAITGDALAELASRTAGGVDGGGLRRIVNVIEGLLI